MASERDTTENDAPLRLMHAEGCRWDDSACLGCNLARAWDQGFAEGAIAAHGLEARDNPYTRVTSPEVSRNRDTSASVTPPGSGDQS